MRRCRVAAAFRGVVRRARVTLPSLSPHANAGLPRSPPRPPQKRSRLQEQLSVRFKERLKSNTLPTGAEQVGAPLPYPARDVLTSAGL